MKSHDRQVSQEIKIFKQSPIDLSPYRFEVVAKNFKKKQLTAEPQSQSNSNFTRLDPYRKTEVRSSPNKSDSKPKPGRKRSLQKFLSNQRISERTSLNTGQGGKATLSTRSKMMKISNLMCCRVQGTTKEMLLQIYQRHNEYQSLVKEWKHLDIFDEVDKLVQSILDSHLQMIEDLLQESFRQHQQEIDLCRQTIETLKGDNQRMEKQMRVYTCFQDVYVPLKEKIMDEYEKSQWSTFILNTLALKSFDVQSFVKDTPLYLKWMQAYRLHKPSEDQSTGRPQKVLPEKMASGTKDVEVDRKRRQSA